MTVLREYMAPLEQDEQASGYFMGEEENWYTDELGSSEHVAFALQQARALNETSQG